MQDLLQLLKELNVPQVESKIFIMPIDPKEEELQINYQQHLDLDTEQKY